MKPFSSDYNNFLLNFKLIISFYDLLLKLDKLVLKNKINITNQKRKTLFETRNLISALRLKMGSLKDAETNDIDENLRNLSESLWSVLNFLDESKNAAVLFIKSRGNEITHFNTLSDNLLLMNGELEKFRDSPAWNDIALSAKRIFKCESVLSKDSGIRTGLRSSKAVMHPGEESLDDYVQLSMCFDLEDPELKKIVDVIMGPVADVFYKRTFIRPLKVHPYSAIVGPSFMGKTQFAFILARIRPVFYFNFFLERNDPQNIYTCFDCYSDELMRTLALDEESLSKTPYLKELSESENIFHQKDLKLYTVGFIWSLIEHSLKYDYGRSDGDWFYHYLANREVAYKALTLNEFYGKMSALYSDPNKLSKFKVPIVFIDELPKSRSREIKLLRNIIRCLVLPCVLSSTNSDVSNRLNIGSDTSKQGNFISVNVIRRLLEANLEGILKRIGVINGKKLIYYVDKSFNLKETKKSVICLLADLSITCDDANKNKLIKIWKFMLSQSKTCLQGSSYYSYFFLVQELLSFEKKSLNACELWKQICERVHLKFKSRKQQAFKNVGSSFSLRMFSTNVKFTEDQVETNSKKTKKKSPKIEEKDNEGEELVRNSIDHHFYHFGDQDGPSVLQFGHDEDGLTLNDEPYPLRSHFLSFEQDAMTSIALWTNIVQTRVKGKNTIASIVQAHVNGLVGIFSNSSARSNDFRAQEAMTYLAITNASHQNFIGKTGGVEFFLNFFENIQIHSVDFGDIKIPKQLDTFLNTLTIPYLVPEKLSPDFISLIEGLCDFGFAYRCSNETGMDICFDVSRNGTILPAYVEQGKKDIQYYIDGAKSKKSVLTILVSYKINEDLKNIVETYASKTKKSDIKPGNRILRNQAAENVLEPNQKRIKKDFKLTVFSFCFEDTNKHHEMKKLTIKTISEVENPDGVFIVLESNFNVRKN